MTVRSFRVFSANPSTRSTTLRSPMLATAAVVACSASGAMADISGFNNLNGWTYNQPDSGSPASTPNANTVQFTTGNGQRRSIFFNAAQDITQFNATFTYRAADFGGSLVGQGICFVIQNNASGANAIGSGNGGLGYFGMTNSAALSIASDTGPGFSYNGFWSNGVISGFGNNMTPVNAFNFRDLNVTISYAGGQALSITVVDPVIPGSPFVRNYILPQPLPAIVGGNTARIGFTASTGDGFGNGGSNQFLSNFSYVVPAPSSAVALGLAGLFGMRRHRR